MTWKSFLLRPRPATHPRTLEKFKRYTESWRAAAAEEPAAGFKIWFTEEGPPSHSLPPHQVAKAAARIGQEAFTSIHDLLLDAYFRRSRDISSEATLRELWQEASLPADSFSDWQDPEILRSIEEEFREALENGAGGAPAVRMDGNYSVVMGAQPTEVYRRWIKRILRK